MEARLEPARRAKSGQVDTVCRFADSLQIGRDTVKRRDRYEIGSWLNTQARSFPFQADAVLRTCIMKRLGVAFVFLTGETARGTRSGIMAKPRVFVSSTYYDLKHVRSFLERFISSLGFDPVLFERGDVAYAPDKALDESCYREVKNCDIYLLIIGGRYGSERSETKGDKGRAFYDTYESVTKTEYRYANEKDIPIYIAIEKSVYAEYQTYLRKTNR